MTTSAKAAKTWRSQGVTIPFFMRDRHTCVHEHFKTKNYIETHSAPLTTLFLSIQDAPGMNPADPLGCLYLSIQIENVLQYSVTLLTTFIGWGRALSDCHRQALFLVATTVMIYATGHLVPVSQLVDISY
jgi:hypothetical protein